MKSETNAPWHKNVNHQISETLRWLVVAIVVLWIFVLIVLGAVSWPQERVDNPVDTVYVQAEIDSLACLQWRWLNEPH